jgi:hypothetical protein
MVATKRADIVLKDEDFPVLIELIDVRDGLVVWSQVVELPSNRVVAQIDIPPPEVERQGYIGVRMTYGDGYVGFQPPPTIH